MLHFLAHFFQFFLSYQCFLHDLTLFFICSSFHFFLQLKDMITALLKAMKHSRDSEQQHLRQVRRLWKELQAQKTVRITSLFYFMFKSSLLCSSLLCSVARKCRGSIQRSWLWNFDYYSICYLVFLIFIQIAFCLLYLSSSPSFLPSFLLSSFFPFLPSFFSSFLSPHLPYFLLNMMFLPKFVLLVMTLHLRLPLLSLYPSLHSSLPLFLISVSSPLSSL